MKDFVLVVRGTLSLVAPGVVRKVHRTNLVAALQLDLARSRLRTFKRINKFSGNLFIIEVEIKIKRHIEPLVRALETNLSGHFSQIRVFVVVQLLKITDRTHQLGLPIANSEPFTIP